jgi:hypothetical protein
LFDAARTAASLVSRSGSAGFESVRNPSSRSSARRANASRIFRRRASRSCISVGICGAPSLSDEGGASTSAGDRLLTIELARAVARLYPQAP